MVCRDCSEPAPFHRQKRRDMLPVVVGTGAKAANKKGTLARVSQPNPDGR